VTGLRVGFTFDLRDDHLAEGASAEDVAEFDLPVTIDAIDGALSGIGHEVERIGHVGRLVEALAAGRRWDLVFNFAEGSRGFGREAQVPALLDAYDIPYTFSDALACALTLHKAMAKHVLRGLGLPTPDFAVVADADEAERVRLAFPLFVKPVAEGSSKGVHDRSRVTTRAELRAACAAVIDRFGQPALVEAFLPGREVTVGIVGSGARAESLGVLETAFARTDGVHGLTEKADFRDWVDYRLAEGPLAAEAERLALAAWRGLGCRDGGRVDLRCDADGRPQLLEINPLPGLRPSFSDLCVLCDLLGIPYGALIGRIVASALERVPSARAELLGGRA
jgi:D-alanine-D-alanine ligase